ncbi:unnamed protein product [Caenorhabditis auriculariae]|uniref:Uncharacterized protein n=1 Tax=Caenorhabditis auriculariae TaxID=2777116 RepID=A0A8S1HW72_9PELO|nr:unnamed protein product [Caenorhabditis auriculariae]
MSKKSYRFVYEESRGHQCDTIVFTESCRKVEVTSTRSYLDDVSQKIFPFTGNMKVSEQYSVPKGYTNLEFWTNEMFRYECIQKYWNERLEALTGDKVNRRAGKVENSIKAILDGTKWLAGVCNEVIAGEPVPPIELYYSRREEIKRIDLVTAQRINTSGIVPVKNRNSRSEEFRKDVVRRFSDAPMTVAEKIEEDLKVIGDMNFSEKSRILELLKELKNAIERYTVKGRDMALPQEEFKNVVEYIKEKKDADTETIFEKIAAARKKMLAHVSVQVKVEKEEEPHIRTRSSKRRLSVESAAPPTKSTRILDLNQSYENGANSPDSGCAVSADGRRDSERERSISVEPVVRQEEISEPLKSESPQTQIDRVMATRRTELVLARRSLEALEASGNKYRIVPTIIYAIDKSIEAIDLRQPEVYLMFKQAIETAAHILVQQMNGVEILFTWTPPVQSTASLENEQEERSTTEASEAKEEEEKQEVAEPEAVNWNVASAAPNPPMKTRRSSCNTQALLSAYSAQLNAAKSKK